MRRSPAPSPRLPKTSVAAKAVLAIAAAARQTRSTSQAPPARTKHCSAESTLSAAMRARPTGSVDAIGRTTTGRNRSETASP
eukprot:9632785-Alexandrium_andersonii.AAC.1